MSLATIARHAALAKAIICAGAQPEQAAGPAGSDTQRVLFARQCLGDTAAAVYPDQFADRTGRRPADDDSEAAGRQRRYQRTDRPSLAWLRWQLTTRRGDMLMAYSCSSYISKKRSARTA